MTKISSLTELLGAGVDQANDLLTIVDMSETGAARNKKIKITQLLGLVTDIVGLLDFKGSTDCSGNPNYPAASKGDFYLVSVAGKIGGASGIVVEAGDSYFAIADNAGGTQAGVGSSWTVIQGNITYAPVNKAGDTMTGDLIVPDEAYDATAWNGSLEVPTKNAVRDKIEAVIAGSGSVSDAAYGVGWDGDTTTAPSKNAVYDKIETLTGGSVTSWKQAVRAATTANGTLASAFENGDTIDGVTLATGDRILLKNQTTATENGIYTVNASGAPTRATDADTGAEMLGAIVPVCEGTVNADRIFQCTNNATIALGSTNLVFVELLDLGAASGRGDILYRGANGWARLAAGADGQVLRTQGSSADPVWGRQKHRGALVTKGSDQTAANYSAGAALTFDTEDYDTDTIHDNSTNPSRLTVPSGVTKIRLTGNVFLSNVTASEVINLDVRKNGVQFVIGLPNSSGANAFGFPRANVASAVMTVTAGDYFELFLTTSGDTSITVTATGTWFAMDIIE